MGWLGVHEDETRADDLGKLYAQATGQRVFDPQDTAWCSIFIGAMLGRDQFDLAGVTPMVKSWLALRDGRRIADLRDAHYGDIIILDRTANPQFGHGGFYVGSDARYVQLLGGNQGDRVSIARFRKDRLAGIVRPVPNNGRVHKPAPDKGKGGGGDDFERAVRLILDHEGGWSNDADDPGGATNYGITINTFRSWRALKGLGGGSEGQLRALTPNEARDIYRELYWTAAKCESLESFALRLMHFDTSVNQGVARAIQFLQLALGVDVDGQFGPETARAEDRADQNTLLTEYAAQRMRHYGNLSGFAKFGLGWSRRLMRTLAAASVSAPVAPATETNETPPQDGTVSALHRMIAAAPESANISLTIALTKGLKRLVRPPGTTGADPSTPNQSTVTQGEKTMNIISTLANLVFNRLLGKMDGGKTIFGLILGIAGLFAGQMGVEPVAPSGTFAEILNFLVEAFTNGSMGATFAGLGLAHRAGKEA